jgi:hypothetical protein
VRDTITGDSDEQRGTPERKEKKSDEQSEMRE